MQQGLDPRSGFDPEMVARSVTVEIEAPAAIVWDVLTDLPRYGEWNPFCIKAVSTLEMGAPVEMTLRNLWDDEVAVMTEYVCAFEPERLLSWEMYWTEAWPYAGRRDQIIAPLGPDRCSYRTTDAFLGENAIHIMRFAKGWIEAGFNATAHALKQRAETLHAARVSAAPRPGAPDPMRSDRAPR